jgi:hypothetical protein
MIDVHCPDSPTGRHEFELQVTGPINVKSLVCEHCSESGLSDEALLRYLNAAMMLTADEAERYDSDEQLGNYARTWRGE